MFMSGENERTERRGWRIVFVAFALLLAILYDVFFWKAEPTVGFLIFIALYVAVFLVLIQCIKQFRRVWPLLLLVPALVMGVDVLLYNNDLVYYWVPWFVVILLFLFSALITLRNPNRYLLFLSKVNVLTGSDLPLLTKIIDVCLDLFVWKGASRNSRVAKVCIGILISLPLIFLFGFLFAKADIIFADVVRNFFDVQLDASLLWRIFRTALLAFLLSSVFYALIDKGNTLGEKKERVVKIDAIIGGTILGLVNALFLIFVVIQFAYLFGGAEFVLEGGITFADYARKGFFELAWVIGFAALLLLFFYRSAASQRAGAVLKVLKLLFIVQVGVIAASAAQRMNLYQEAYGFTVLRLYVEWFIYFVMIVLAFVAVSMLAKWPFRVFFHGTLIFAVAALAAVSSVNVDRMIARENVERYVAGGKELDMAYLLKLSVDAIPSLLPLSKDENQVNLSDEQIWSLDAIVRKGKVALEKKDSWTEFQVGDNRAREALGTLEQGLKARLDKIKAAHEESRKESARKAAGVYKSIDDFLLRFGVRRVVGCHSFPELFLTDDADCGEKATNQAEYEYIVLALLQNINGDSFQSFRQLQIYEWSPDPKKSPQYNRFVQNLTVPRSNGGGVTALISGGRILTYVSSTQQYIVYSVEPADWGYQLVNTMTITAETPASEIERALKGKEE